MQPTCVAGLKYPVDDLLLDVRKKMKTRICRATRFRSGTNAAREAVAKLKSGYFFGRASGGDSCISAVLRGKNSLSERAGAENRSGRQLMRRTEEPGC